jgi:casein kinase II subunit alpha
MLVRRLGAGKFSDVFEAVDRKLETAVQRNDSNKSSTATASSGMESIHPQTMVVLKCLKPVNEQKIKRELLVLQHASKLPNLARLLAIVVPPAYYPSFHHAPATGGEDSAVGPPAVPSNNNTPRLQAMPTLVLEHAHGEWLSHPKQHMLPHHQEDAPSHSEFLTEDEIRFFIFHLLVALDSLHACGIMHRDVKPRNVLINRTKKTLMLIDLGLADFYFASTPTAQEHKYNVRVASRHYKSPELLLGYQQYGTAIDLWGVGCILAGLLLRKEPFFRGKDNLDQLATIVAVLGTANLHLYMAKYNIEMTPEIQSVIAEATLQGRGAQRPWVSFLDTSTSSPSSMTPHPSAEGLDLLSKLLQYDHEYRLTAKEAMQHPFFDPVRMSIQRGLFEERAAMMQD